MHKKIIHLNGFGSNRVNSIYICEKTLLFYSTIIQLESFPLNEIQYMFIKFICLS